MLGVLAFAAASGAVQPQSDHVSARDGVDVLRGNVYGELHYPTKASSGRRQVVQRASADGQKLLADCPRQRLDVPEELVAAETALAGGDLDVFGTVGTSLQALFPQLIFSLLP